MIEGNRPNYKCYYIDHNGNQTEITMNKPIEIWSVDDKKEYVEPLPHEISESFSFTMSRKAIYRFKKVLGVIKPIYLKKKKGKRYIRYEII